MAVIWDAIGRMFLEGTWYAIISAVDASRSLCSAVIMVSSHEPSLHLLPVRRLEHGRAVSPYEPYVLRYREVWDVLIIVVSHNLPGRLEYSSIIGHLVVSGLSDASSPAFC